MNLYKKMVVGAAIAIHAIGISNADMVTNRIEDNLKKQKVTVSKFHDASMENECATNPGQENLPTGNPYLDDLLNIVSVMNPLFSGASLDRLPEGVKTETLETYEYIRKDNAAVDVFENGTFAFNYVNHKKKSICLPENVKIWINDGIVAAIQINNEIYPFQQLYIEDSGKIVTTGNSVRHCHLLQTGASKIFMNFTGYQIDVGIMLMNKNTFHVSGADKKNYLQSKVYPELAASGYK